MDAFALVAEAKIRAAIEAGEFDGLEGHGKPLPPDALARVPDELRMGMRILRNAGCLPPELEARREVARLGALLDALGDGAAEADAAGDGAAEAEAVDARERARLSRLRADAELRYRTLIERRRQSRA